MKGLAKFIAETPNQVASLVLHFAGQGNANAQAKLAQMLLDGYGIKQDHSLALKWFKIAVMNDHIEAINMVGRCYENGWGCDLDYKTAASYYKLAADKGLNWGLYNFANLLIKGKGTAKNVSLAYDLYHQAALKGHAKSMNLVGRFYEEGWLFEVDLEEATDWYRRSASAGDFRGQCSYASVLTAEGRVDEAVIWLKQAMQTATQGFLKKIARILLQSPHKALVAVSLEMFKKCALAGNEEDLAEYVNAEGMINNATTYT